MADMGKRGGSTHKKSYVPLVLISTMVLLLSALLTIRVISLIEPKIPSPVKQAEVRLVDTPNYNACLVLKTSTIKATSTFITEVAEGMRFGATALNGAIADGCSFGFSTAKTANNFLTVQVYKYASPGQTNDSTSTDDTWSEAAVPGYKAYFATNTKDKTVVYKLRVLTDVKNVLFELHQPTFENSFDASAARALLIDIATKADYEIINPKASSLI